MRNLFVLIVLLLVRESFSADRPNVILFIADDVSWNDFGCYGNPFARTPNIDALAAAGMQFNNAYLTASSCSPSRASIVTGRYPHNNGRAAELHLPIAANLPWFPELLREAGYYTALSGKNHMSVDSFPAGATRPAAFDLIDGGKAPGNSGGHANWRKLTKQRPKSKPFFFWFASYDAHRGWDADNEWQTERFGPAHTAERVVVPPFLIDDQATRDDLASYYNEVTRFDYFIGEVVAELREQNQLENTLIMILADNGRPFPRAKTRLHDSGMKTAMVAHWPAGIAASQQCDSLVSVIDIAPTIISLADLTPPPTMQGVSLESLLEDSRASVRDYAFSEHNWHDYEAHGRSIRDGRFLFIKNNRPQQAWQGPADSVRSPSHLRLQEIRNQGKLTGPQADVFLAPRPIEELYLVAEDPNQTNNLIEYAVYAADASRLRKLLAEWSEETHDSVPADLSADFFDRESGKQLPIKNGAFRGTTPGQDRAAHEVVAPSGQ